MSYKKLLNQAIRQELKDKVTDAMKKAAVNTIDKVLEEYIGDGLDKERCETCSKFFWWQIAYIVDHQIRDVFATYAVLEENEDDKNERQHQQRKYTISNLLERWGKMIRRCYQANKTSPINANTSTKFR